MSVDHYTRLASILDSLPSDGLSALTAATGRPGHGVKVLFRAYLASFVLNTSSISAALRLITDDSHLAEIVGGTPTKQSVSRFIRKLKNHTELVEQCMSALTSDLRELLPDLGHTVAVDSTDIKAWSAAKGAGSDSEATWSAKRGNDGRTKWWLGYKMHLIADPVHELPVGAYVTPANESDMTQMGRSLDLLKGNNLQPQYLLADAGYDSALNRLYVESDGAIPIIKRNKRRGAVQEPNREWQAIYDRRTGIERCFSRLKDFRRLNRLTMRGLAKATIHCLCAILTMIAGALIAMLLGNPEELRCVA